MQKTGKKMGRPPKPQLEKAKRYSATFDPSLLNRLKWVAKEATLSQSHIMKEGLVLLFTKEPYKTLIQKYNREKLGASL